ncbi:AAA domain-containing protein [Persicitalea jodogahamensis]|nr:AAA domain-containing protein [Persicitalea jodogahamensis]
MEEESNANAKSRPPIAILKTYLKRLTNLSSRNKSLLLSRLAAEQFLDLHEADFLLSKSSFEILNQLIQRKNRIPLCDVQDPRFDKVNEVSKRLRRIARTERFIEEERGARDLYVGYPFVRGKFADGSVVHAPLLFFPVTLRLDREQWCLVGRDDAEISLNRSFALAYAQFNEAQVPDEILEKNFEDFPKEALEFRTALYEWLKESPFRLNFNQQLFENVLQPFEALKSSDLQSLEKNGELKLYPEMVLGIFPQAGSFLVPDYNYLLHEADQEDFSMPLFNFETESGEDAESINVSVQNQPLREEQILTPLPVDLSQENVIRLVKQGESVVVQGPPGTGKSQLICNLMADFAAQGKRVLLVCQKRAALDVVHQRLQTLGLGLSTALIHDFRNDRAELYRQIAIQIDKVEEYQALNQSLDAVFLDREFTRNSRLIDQTVKELEEFRTALFDEAESGLSVKELYLSSDPAAPHVNLQAYYRNFLLSETENYRRRLTSYATYNKKITPPHAWHDRQNFADYGLGDLRRMEEALIAWPSFFQAQKEQFEEITRTTFSLDFIADKAETSERIKDLALTITDAKTLQLFQRYLTDQQPATSRLAFVRQVTDTFEGWRTDGSGIESTLAESELAPFRKQLARAIAAKASAVKGQWWEWFGKEKAAVAQVAQANGLSTRLDDLKKLEVRLNNRLELEQWLASMFLSFRPDDLESNLPFEEGYLLFFQKAEQAADAVVRVRRPPWEGVLTQLALGTASISAFRKIVQELLVWLSKWQSQEEAMLDFLTENQWQEVLSEPENYPRQLRDGLRADFDVLVEMDKIANGFSAVEADVTNLVLNKSEGENSSENTAVTIFDNSLHLAWIEHIEGKYPTLRAVSSLKMSEWEQQLQASIERKQSLSRDITLMKLRELIYENVEKNRLGNRTTYRELAHQTTKKRNIWPIRKVVEAFSDEVFRLIPCWMASPEAVSTLFPMKAGLFDLVIFDEASQCYAEYGLPAAYRGKQVVITGDSKQLPPSDLYRVRYEENSDEEVPVAIEIDSLLDLAAQTLTQRQLTGHYRSSSLDLIDFSNQHFYKNTLRLLPDFTRVNDAEPGIHYMHVDGIWEKNTNPVEAQRVLELVRELSESKLSIGVVTFNFHQQQLVQDLLEKEKVTAEGLFVKNIENVQGDERDVIIFSIGYAPDDRGKLAMQFGTLNTQGGENRLNVAVTRARQRVYVVTSLFPPQLRTEQTANEGPKLLKAYLQYALDVSEGRYRPQPVPNSGYRGAWLLKDRISRQFPDYRQELPFADLTRRSAEGTYEGLLLTDDDIYFGSLSVKEPHAYLPMVLRMKHWPFQRMYSRDYWLRRGSVYGG